MEVPARRGNIMGPRRWTVGNLELLKQDYCNHAMSLAAVAHKWGTSAGRIAILARRNGWTPRQKSARIAPLAERLAPMLVRREQLSTYIRNLQRELHFLNKQINSVEDYSQKINQRGKQ